MIALVAALVQAATWSVVPEAPTVGDTVRLVRRLSVPPGVQPRVRPLPGSEAVVALAGPQATYADGVLTVVYTLAAFEPGPHEVALPDAELLFPDGRVETVRGGTIVVRIRSVLPRDAGPPEPKPSLGPLPRAPTRAAPLIVLVGAALGMTVLWGVARRRTGPRPAPLEDPVTSSTVPIDRWVAAGEPRAVAAATADRARAWIAAHVPDAGRQLDTDTCLAVLRSRRPEWPLHELADLLRSLERARFAPAVPTDVMIVVDQAELLLQRLGDPHGAGEVA